MQPSELYHQLYVPSPPKLHVGLDWFAHKLIGKYRQRSSVFRQLMVFADQVEMIVHEQISVLDHTQLTAEVKRLSAYFLRNAYTPIRITSEVLQAMAVIVELSARTLGLRPHKVQILGALGLYSGYLVEMATGEGKSLTAAMAAILTGWKRRPCHILTVNSYLAERDADEFRKFYRQAGLSVGYVIDGMSPDERREQYRHAVVYTTSKELLADFLRDRIGMGNQYTPEQMLIHHLASNNDQQTVNNKLVLRGIDTAIVDESDSILIDEAVSPLIISSTKENPEFIDAIRTAKDLADYLHEKIHYNVDQEYKSVDLTEQGENQLTDLVGTLSGFWRGRDRRNELVIQALTARLFFHRDKHYIVQDGRIVIIDEFTGRLTPNRSWGNGLHQAIEALEYLEITPPNETIARMSFQKFFRLFKCLSGMTGTAKEATAEFWGIYQLPVLALPTHQPVHRISYPTHYHLSQDDKWDSIVESVKALHLVGRPILIGVRTIHESEYLASRLLQEGLRHYVLNATRNRDEAGIVLHAGRHGSITISTNMAGRGTDIKLDEAARQSGGLHVILTGLNDSGRVDRQLMGRCSRQGDPGSVQTFVSLDDEIIKAAMPEAIYEATRKLLTRFNSSPRNFFQHQLYRYSQKRLENLAQKRRRMVLKADNWLEESLTFGRG